MTASCLPLPVGTRARPRFIRDSLKGGLPGEEFGEKGRDVPESIESAKFLERAGYGALNGREPDAGNLHIQFDERGVETELRTSR